MIDQLLQLRAALPHAEQLIHLLLIFHHGETRFRVIQNKLDFIGHRILIQRHGHAADALHRDHRPVELRPVVTDNRHFVAPLHAECSEAAGQRTGLIEHLAPTPFLPDPKGFFANRNLVRVPLRPLQQAFRKGVEGIVPDG